MYWNLLGIFGFLILVVVVLSIFLGKPISVGHASGLAIAAVLFLIFCLKPTELKVKDMVEFKLAEQGKQKKK